MKNLSHRSFLKSASAAAVAITAAPTILNGSRWQAVAWSKTSEQQAEQMKWFSDARFGMFIHWGVYAVPAGTYDGKQIDGVGEWIMLHGEVPVKEYKAYAKKFNPLKYDPEECAATGKVKQKIPKDKLDILKKNGYDGVLIPDHTPQISCEGSWYAGMAYAMGYMKATLNIL